MGFGLGKKIGAGDLELSEDSIGSAERVRVKSEGLYRKVCKDVWIDLYDLGLILVGVVCGGMEGELDGWLGFGFRDLLFDLDKKKGLDLHWENNSGGNAGESDRRACKGCL